MKPVLRNNTYHLRRRVPARFASVEDRREVWVSLKTDSLEVARAKAPSAWAEMLEAWELMLAGDVDDGEARLSAAVSIAQRRGFKYLPAADVAQLPLPDVVSRIEAAHARPGKPNLMEARALLGAVNTPDLRVSDAMQFYLTSEKHRTLGKSKDQLRRWLNPRKKAVRNFITVNGDIALQDIEPRHMQDFADWWTDRVFNEGLSAETANKDIVHVSDIFRTTNKKKRLNLYLPLDGWMLNRGDVVSRPPFSTKWICTRLLKDGALMGLNAEARHIVLGMINTGYRPSEGASLTGDTIHLDGDLPHISIEPTDRILKTQYARRILPLAGVSLEAFKAFPNGFPNYNDNATLSGTVNKFFKENGLRETPRHTLYSLRHSFEDRLLAQNVPDRLAADLMGHTTKRARYGAGAALAQRMEAIRKIAL